MDFFSCCSSRPENKPPPTAQQPKFGGDVGVGIVFQPDHSGALHVKSLALGGPADKSGLVQVNDELHEIDGVNVYRKPVGDLAPLILGPVGTTVTLGLRRADMPNLVKAELKRGWTMDTNSVGAKSWSHPLPEHARLSHFAKKEDPK